MFEIIWNASRPELGGLTVRGVAGVTTAAEAAKWIHSETSLSKKEAVAAVAAGEPVAASIRSWKGEPVEGVLTVVVS